MTGDIELISEWAMLKHRVAPVLALLLTLVTPSVYAYVGPATLTPSSPVAGQVLALNLPYGVCDAVGQVPGFPQITVTGNVIQIVVFTLHAFDPEECFYPMSIATIPVGPFSAGNYSVQVDAQYNNGGITQYTVGALALTVQNATAPIGAPALGAFAGAIIVLLLSVLGCVTIRHCRRGMSRSMASASARQ